MSAAEEREAAGQLVVDGLPVTERTMGLQGTLHIDPDVYAALKLGDRVRVTLECNIASRRDDAKRSKWGDDEAHRTVGIGIHRTVAFDVIERDATVSDAERIRVEEKAQRQAEREDERAKREAAAAGEDNEKPKRRGRGATGARRARAANLRPVDGAPDDPTAGTEAPAE